MPKRRFGTERRQSSLVPGRDVSVNATAVAWTINVFFWVAIVVVVVLLRTG
ncbi:MAG TPA: hypothetical protein VGN69_11335 [Solirubrobacteraceae bacterium]|jgi:hypothetical protein|nr:hypothetical protein [Solirubrobacteraceae bacterium]